MKWTKAPPQPDHIIGSHYAERLSGFGFAPWRYESPLSTLPACQDVRAFQTLKIQKVRVSAPVYACSGGRWPRPGFDIVNSDLPQPLTCRSTMRLRLPGPWT